MNREFPHYHPKILSDALRILSGSEGGHRIQQQQPGRSNELKGGSCACTSLGLKGTGRGHELLCTTIQKQKLAARQGLHRIMGLRLRVIRTFFHVCSTCRKATGGTSRMVRIQRDRIQIEASDENLSNLWRKQPRQGLPKHQRLSKHGSCNRLKHLHRA